MSKLIKQNYKTKSGETKLHCYRVMLSKELVDKSDLKADDEIKISVRNGKIIIERSAR